MTDPRGDPIDNLCSGCLWPIARSFLLVALCFIIAAVTALLSHDTNWFFIIMLGGGIGLWALERTVFRDRNAREKTALHHLLGIRDE